MTAASRPGDAMPDGVTVSAADMYALLLRIDAKVSSLVQTAEGLEDRVADHEARLRVVEAKVTAALEAQRVPEESKAKTQPTTIIALLIAAASIVTTVLLYTIDR
jgi:predicted nucleic acid-binding protein